MKILAHTILIMIVLTLWFLFLLDYISIYIPIFGNVVQVILLLFVANTEVHDSQSQSIKQIRSKKLKKLWK